MRELLWITERELRERRLVLVGAFLIGLLTLATPLLPMLRSEKPLYLINTGATIMGVAISVAVAILAGGSALGRDLAERRLGFYFSKPLGSMSIWGGKMLGALLLALLSGLLVVLPATLLGGGLVGGFSAGGRSFGVPSFLLGMVLDLAFLVAFAHACSIALRARSKWILLDVVVLPLLVFFFWLSLRPLLLGGGANLVLYGLIAFGCAFLLATVTAGAVGVVTGRSDIRVVHRGLSQTLAAIVGLFVLGFAGYSIWVRSADPSDLTRMWGAHPAPRGTWVSTGGQSAGRGDYMPGFLIDAVTKESLRMGGVGWDSGRLTFSADGTHAAWVKLASVALNGPMIADLMMAELGPNPVVRRTNLTINPQTLETMILSPDGSRLGLVQNGTLSVIEMRSEASLATTLVSIKHRSLRIDFVSNNLIRIYLTAEVSANARTKAVEILEFDVPSHHLSHSGAFEGIRLLIGPDHDRLITSTVGNIGYRAGEYHVLDARTGGQLASLGRLAEGETGQAWLTSRGSLELVIASRPMTGSGKARAELHGSDGRLSGVIDLGLAHNAVLGGEPAAGKMVVALYSGPSDATGELVLIDLDNGNVRKVAHGLTLVYRPWTGMFPKPGSIATKLYEEGAGRLVYFDPLTGDRHTIAGR